MRALFHDLRYSLRGIGRNPAGLRMWLRRIPWWVIVTSVLIIAGGAMGWWYWFRPRVITVCVFTDEAYRHSEAWRATLDSRFQAVSKIYERTARIRWKVTESRPRPTDHRRDGIDAQPTRLLDCEIGMSLAVFRV